MAVYADLTWNDPNPLKRWVQRRRLADALARVPADKVVRSVIDYGAGDGALAALAAARWPKASIVCFEPDAELAAQAGARLDSVSSTRVVREEADLMPAADVIFCTEVFEHLPDAESERALDEMVRLLKSDGMLVVGVPVEVGLPALAKGLFRALRRANDYDGSMKRIGQATLGRPPLNRPTADWSGRRYHPHHLGFDHRVLRRRLEARFGQVRLKGSPFAWLPVFLNSEAYMTAKKDAEKR